MFMDFALTPTCQDLGVRQLLGYRCTDGKRTRVMIPPVREDGSRDMQSVKKRSYLIPNERTSSVMEISAP
jgi:hypothetical protein